MAILSQAGVAHSVSPQNLDLKMLAKCANPTCSESFLYLHQGKLFLLDISDDAGAGRSCRNGRPAPHGLRYFWLCDVCHRSMTVVAEQGGKVKVVPLTAFRGEQTSWEASANFLGAGLNAVDKVRRKPAA